MRNIRKVTVLGTVAAIAAAGASVGVVNATPPESVQAKAASEDIEPNVVSDEAHAAAVATVERLEPRMAVFQRARLQSDVVPDEVNDGPLNYDRVIDAGLSRGGSFSRPAWITPSTDGRSLCVMTPSSLNCAAASDIEKRGMSITVAWNASSPVRVSGIATDGVKSAEVVLADGTTQAVEVQNNLLDFETPEPPKAVRWTGPAGAVEQPLNLPTREPRR